VVQVLAGPPLLRIEDVLLQQRPERLHRRVVTGGRRRGPSTP
jgi:hypothetical protein